jgi:hypothetical protein
MRTTTYAIMEYDVTGVFRHSCSYFRFAILSPNKSLFDVLQMGNGKNISSAEEALLCATTLNARHSVCSYCGADYDQKYYQLEVLR